MKKVALVTTAVLTGVAAFVYVAVGKFVENTGRPPRKRKPHKDDN